MTAVRQERWKATMPFEHRSQPLLPRPLFRRRVTRYAAIALCYVFGALAIGILGYHYFEKLSWLDSLLNASMILGGMGPVDPVRTVAGKIFASCYALFSGIVFLVAAGILFAPVIHRFLHRLHVEMGTEQKDAEG